MKIKLKIDTFDTYKLHVHPFDIWEREHIQEIDLINHESTDYSTSKN